MKKLTMSLALLGVVVVACQKPEPALSVPEESAFTASVESFDSQTKTSMTPERTVVWTAGDRLAIFQGSTIADKFVATEASAGQVNGYFELDEDNSEVNGGFSAGTELSCNVAFYPYSENLSLTGDVLDEEGTIYKVNGIVLPAEQTYTEGSFANGAFPMVAVTKTMGDHTLKFKNVLGALKLQLKGTQTVKSIKVTGKNNEILSGTAVVTAYTNNLTPAITMTASDEASKSVTLNCGDGVPLYEAATTDFIISLPPLSFNNGFTVEILDSEGIKTIVETDIAHMLLRSAILVMPAIDINDPQADVSGTIDYIDENGVNNGKGVLVDGVIWAPVNCGFNSADFPYGKLYQWGRRYGQGLGEEYDLAEIRALTGGVNISAGQSSLNSDAFFVYKNDWLDEPNESLWGDGSKTAFDPCPNGWRVPTFDELSGLCQNHSDFTINEEGRYGMYFSGSSSYSGESSKVFLEASGFRYESGILSCVDENGAYWTSTPSGNESIGMFFLQDNHVDSDCYDNRSRGYSIRCVKDNVTLVSAILLDKSSLTMYPASSYLFATYMSPSDATVIELTWSSSDESVATVNQNGEVTAVADGTATITALAVGGASATCAVTVKSAISTEVRNYIVDGKDYGPGIKIGQTIWAPVNCGYEPAASDYKGYPYGKLYQWGRKYGQGYSGRQYDLAGNNIGEMEDATFPSGENISSGGVTSEVANHVDNAEVFYTQGSDADWSVELNNNYWRDSEGKKNIGRSVPRRMEGSYFIGVE